MKLSVIGCGYLGAVHAAAMASIGHDVIGIDVDPSKIDQLSRGEAPFFEPGLPEILRAGLESGRLKFSNDFADAADADVHFVAVGTPQQSGSNSADLRYVDSAVEQLLTVARPGSLIVGKSTVPVGTASRLADIVEDYSVYLAWNPEFLREGFAVADTLRPDRIVYGLPSSDSAPVIAEILDAVYHEAIALDTPVLKTDFATAELVKVSANAFLATKISFINGLAEICEATGADVTQLADAIGLDDRIGRKFLNAGVGFGGGCLPKDIRAFMARASELDLGSSVGFLESVDAINERRREHVVNLAKEILSDDLTGRRIAILGLSFKPNSDDVRDSPALEIAVRLRALGARVIATDPEAIGRSRERNDTLEYVDDSEAAARGAELVILATEWKEYREIDPVAFGSLVSNKRIVDARNALDPITWLNAGWDYRGMGRYRHSTT